MEQFEIDNIMIGSLPLKPRVALRLDKKITTLIIKTLGGKDTLNIFDFKNMKVESLLNNFGSAFDEMNDEDFVQLALDLLSTSQIVKEDKQVIQITGSEAFDEAFLGCKPITIYKTLFKIMEINKFTPFVLAEEAGLSDIIGTLMQKTSSSNEDETPPPSN